MELKSGYDTQIPIYDFTTHSRSPTESKTVQWNEFIIIEGIFAFYDQRIRDLCSLKIFVQCDSDTALGRRLLRDISERGRSHKEVLTRYNKFVKADFETYIKPYMKHADIIIPGGASNDIGVNFVMNNLKEHLRIVKYKVRGRKSVATAKSEMRELLEAEATMLTSANSDRIIFYEPHSLSKTHLRKLFKTLNHECKSEFILACMKIFVKESVNLVCEWIKKHQLTSKDFGKEFDLYNIDELAEVDLENSKDLIVVYCPFFN